MNKEIQKATPKGITIKQHIRFGKPVIEGTRVAISDMLNLIKAGYNINEIPQQYPGVTKENAMTALEYTANILGKEETLFIS